VHKQINLNSGTIVLIDEADYESIKDYRWKLSSHGYITHQEWKGQRKKPKTFYLHRLIMNPNEGQLVDHINGDKLDNRRENLRLCDKGGNQRNRGKQANNTSGYKGVYLSKKGKLKPWYVKIAFEGKDYSGGYHASKEEAARAYDQLARELHGEFARLNFT
jgi:hypothetical protein